jgi:hypothetical protein
MEFTRMKQFFAYALAALLFVSATPARSAEFSDDQFCAASTQAAKDFDAKGPTWADQVTRSDGLTVDCEGKSIEYKKFVKLNAADMQHGWEDQMQQAWNQIYCSDAPVAAAIANGWTVNVALTMQDNATLPITVSCTQK